MILIVTLERKLTIPCLFLLLTDESDSEGGNYSLTHLSHAKESIKVFNIHTRVIHVEMGST